MRSHHGSDDIRIGLLTGMSLANDDSHLSVPSEVSVMRQRLWNLVSLKSSSTQATTYLHTHNSTGMQSICTILLPHSLLSNSGLPGHHCPIQHFQMFACIAPDQGVFGCLQINPYEPEVNWFSDDKEIMPLSAAPEPKRRFIPSKWEEKK